MIKKYTTTSGETRYLLQTYLGVDPLTGKERRTTRRGFKTQKEAKQAERNLLLDVEENGLPSKYEDQLKNPSFKELSDLWLENYETTVKKSTFQVIKTKVKIFEKDYFNGMKMKQISVAYCQKVAIELSKRYILYNQYFTVIKRIFQYAVLVDILQVNPFDKVIKPKSKQIQKKDNYLTKEELKKFLDIASSTTKGYFFPAVHLISYTGLREGEAIGLKWSDIDFDNEKITISRTASKLEGGQALQVPKTKRSYRTISVDKNTLFILKAWKKEQMKSYFKQGKHFGGGENFVFTNSKCEWVRISTFFQRFKRFIEKNNLKQISPHGLRHTHASLLFSAGVEPKNISDRLGHSTVQITLDLYTHLTEDQRTDTVQKLIDYMVI